MAQKGTRAYSVIRCFRTSHGIELAANEITLLVATEDSGGKAKHQTTTRTLTWREFAVCTHHLLQ